MATKKQDEDFSKSIAELKAMQAELEKAAKTPSLQLRMMRERVDGSLVGQASEAWNSFWDEGNQ
jgi:hypothetical protein